MAPVVSHIVVFTLYVILSPRVSSKFDYFNLYIALDKSQTISV